MLEKYYDPMKVAIFRHTNISKGSDGLTDPTSMFNFFLKTVSLIILMALSICSTSASSSLWFLFYWSKRCFSLELGLQRGDDVPGGGNCNLHAFLNLGMTMTMTMTIAKAMATDTWLTSTSSHRANGNCILFLLSIKTFSALLFHTNMRPST